MYFLFFFCMYGVLFYMIARNVVFYVVINYLFYER